MKFFAVLSVALAGHALALDAEENCGVKAGSALDAIGKLKLVTSNEKRVG